MTDHPHFLEPESQSWRDLRLQQVAAAAPVLKALPRNPAFLIGAAVVGIVGVLAWRNRERISEKTSPLIEDARRKGQQLIDDARLLGHDLIDDALAKTQALGEKASRLRNGGEPAIPPDVH
jgi:hypothetical protein